MTSSEAFTPQLEPVEGTNPAAIYAETLTHAEAEKQIFDLAYNEYVEKAHLLIEALRREADNSAELHKTELQTSAAGNGMAFAGAAAIAGSLMALGPLAPIGIGLSVLGVGTLTAATVIEKVLENRIEEKLKPVLNEYEEACRTFQSVQENASAFATEYKRLLQEEPSTTAETLVARSLAPSVAAMTGAQLATAAAQTTAHTGKILGSSVLSKLSLQVLGKGGSQSAAVAAVGVGTMVASGAFVAVNGALVVKSLVDVAHNDPGEFSKKLSDMADTICRDLGIPIPGCESEDKLSTEALVDAGGDVDVACAESGVVVGGEAGAVCAESDVVVDGVVDVRHGESSEVVDGGVDVRHGESSEVVDGGMDVGCVQSSVVIGGGEGGEESDLLVDSSAGRGFFGCCRCVG